MMAAMMEMEMEHLNTTPLIRITECIPNFLIVHMRKLWLTLRLMRPISLGIQFGGVRHILLAMKYYLCMQ